MKTLTQAENYLHQFIQSRLVPGPIFIERTTQLLRLLGDPQNQVKVIHIAGTSGKSSTASFISQLLANQGRKVGLQLSPHLVDVRERVQINNGLIPKGQFVTYVQKMKPFIEKMRDMPHGLPSYFEIMVAMGYLFFKEQQVEYAVIETGLGGITDPTNTVSRADKICVLTRIGFDHTEILGNTLGEIAFNKAGIIQPGNPVFFFSQPAEVQKVFTSAAKRQGADLHILQADKTYTITREHSQGMTFRTKSENGGEETYQTGLVGRFQVENLTLAVRVVSFAAGRDNWTLNQQAVRKTIETVRMPGRAQMITSAPTPFLIDTAHNEQKMQALLDTLKNSYPGKRFQFLVAFKKGKDYQRMIQQIATVAKRIVITRFLKENQDMVHVSVSPEDVSYELHKLGFLHYHIEMDAAAALESCLSRPEYLTVATGSLYFVGDIYEQFRE